MPKEALTPQLTIQTKIAMKKTSEQQQDKAGENDKQVDDEASDEGRTSRRSNAGGYTGIQA